MLSIIIYAVATTIFFFTLSQESDVIFLVTKSIVFIISQEKQ